jgi:CheY-like chemotaxis protein
MLNVRPPQPDAPDTPDPAARFRVLLTEDRARPDEHWTRQIPPLLGPLGVEASIASDARQALTILESTSIHAAVIDLNTPAPQPSTSNAAANPSGGGGLYLMQVIQRLPHKPPIVVVNSQSYSQRQVQRMLNQALELGAFSVINWPVKIDTLLSTFQRLIERAYNNAWPPEGGNRTN